MNANATIVTNDTTTNNNMNTTRLNPAGNDLLQAISTGGLSALQVVAASGDAFPPLKAAVVEALAIIGIVKVCVLTSIILSHLSMRQYQKFKTNKKDWAAFSESLIEKIEEIIQATRQYNESQVLLTLQPDFENLKGYGFNGVIVDTAWIEVMHQHFGPFERRCDEDPTTEHMEEISQF